MNRCYPVAGFKGSAPVAPTGSSKDIMESHAAFALNSLLMTVLTLLALITPAGAALIDAAFGEDDDGPVGMGHLCVAAGSLLGYSLIGHPLIQVVWLDATEIMLFAMPDHEASAILGFETEPLGEATESGLNTWTTAVVVAVAAANLAAVGLRTTSNPLSSLLFGAIFGAFATPVFWLILINIDTEGTMFAAGYAGMMGLVAGMAILTGVLLGQRGDTGGFRQIDGDLPEPDGLLLGFGCLLLLLGVTAIGLTGSYVFAGAIEALRTLSAMTLSLMCAAAGLAGGVVVGSLFGNAGSTRSACAGLSAGLIASLGHFGEALTLPMQSALLAGIAGGVAAFLTGSRFPGLGRDGTGLAAGLLVGGLAGYIATAVFNDTEPLPVILGIGAALGIGLAAGLIANVVAALAVLRTRRKNKQQPDW